MNRKLFGFDAFGEFPKNGNYEDVNYATHFENVSGKGIYKSALEKFLKLKGINDFTLVKGDILKTLPAFLEKNNLIQIALLHIDTDIYKPTKCILESCYHRVVKGGIIVLDDYKIVSGETKAVDEFFSDKEVQIKKFPFSKIPSYIIKQ